jgi:hypothetical protein
MGPLAASISITPAFSRPVLSAARVSHALFSPLTANQPRPLLSSPTLLTKSGLDAGAAEFRSNTIRPDDGEHAGST